MKTMKSEYNEQDHTFIINVSGEMSASTSFPPLPNKHVQKIVIQLEESGYVNSDGVQCWMKWIKEVQAANENISFNFQFLPANFARLAYQVRGFLPAHSNIESVMVPYFCSQCAINFTVKYTKGINWETEWSPSTFVQKISHANCAICKSNGEIDAIPEVYERLST